MARDKKDMPKMTPNMRFDYFYGKDIEKFNFIKIPKYMIYKEPFRNISSDAKLIYGLLLERTSLSIKNDWFDEQNRAYIRYSIEDIRIVLNCGNNKAVAVLKELVSIGLIEKKKRGQGLTDNIYVKYFMGFYEDEIIESDAEAGASDFQKEERYSLEVENSTEEKCDSPMSSVEMAVEYENMKCEKQTSEDVAELEIKIQRCEKQIPEANAEGKCQYQKCKKQISEIEKACHPVQKCEKTIPKNVKNKLLEVGKTHSNKTNENNTEENNTESNLIYLEDYDIGDKSALRKRWDKMDEYERKRAAYEKIIKANIAYDDLMVTHAAYKDLIQDIYALILDTVLTTNEEIYIAREKRRTSDVVKRFMELKYWHIIYVLDCLHKSTTQKGNIKAYILTALYNAPTTMNLYYQAGVNYGNYGAGHSNA